MTQSRSKYIFNNTVKLALSNIGTKLITFFLVPLYTYTLAAAEYGVADLVTTITFVLAPVLTLNLAESVARFPLDEGADAGKIVTVGALALILSSAVGLLIMPASSLFDSAADYAALIYLYCIANSVFTMSQCFLRGIEKLRAMAFSNILNTGLTALLNILFLVIFDMGVTGYLLAYILAMFASSVFAAISGGLLKYLRHPSIDRDLTMQMIRYSVVLIPNTFMWWIINSSSRIAVAALIGSAANGMLAVSYKLPSIVTVVSNTFTQAWTYSAIHEDASEDRDRFTSSVFDKMITVLGLVTVLLLANIKWLTAFYVAPAYADSWRYSTWLLAGNLMLTLGTFLGTPYSVHKDSRGMLLSGMMGAVMNVVFMFALIPLAGLTGSVMATFASYAAVCLFRFFHTKKYVSIHVRLRRHIPMIVSVALLVCFSTWCEGLYMPLSVACAVATCASYWGTFKAALNAIALRFAR